MDKSWMYVAPRSSERYSNGVESFLNFAFEKSSEDGRILCPCSICHDRFHLSRAEVFDHLLCSGFKKGYLIWKHHGESCVASSSSMTSNEEQGNDQHDMRGLLHDLFPSVPMEGSSLDMNESEGEADLNTEPTMHKDKKKLDDLLKDAEEKVYPNAKSNKLSFLVHLYHIKCLNGWSNKSFSMLLEFLKDELPVGNLVPKKANEVKKIMANLGLGYEKIHACPNGCMLFWKEEAKEQICSFCGASRWKPSHNDSDDEVGLQKKKAINVLRWFPLKPRLQRLFMSSKTAHLMKWHHLEREKDGKLRHPADALAWKDFDKKYPEFASDPRNVRLALSSDGFNPYRTMTISYSIWPVFVIPYNLPPWYVMKQPNFILSLIIPGPKGPENKIDVYMQPLIEELQDLWDVGVETFDASTNENFHMKAAILSTISDFPGYANLSGWSTKGEYACPVCAFDKTSEWLVHGRKWCYMGHRRWLEDNHCWRKDTQAFDGREELRCAPIPPSGDDVLDELEGVSFLGETIEKGPWKKKSIFFMLPYWENLLLRHNLDVMHIEKNVCDNIVGTLLGQVGKSKDNLKARLDLKKMGIREELHPKIRPHNNCTYLPKACYEMTPDEKDVFLKKSSFDPSLTIDEIVAAQTDTRVDKKQFRKLVTHWFTEESQAESEKKKKLRFMSKEPHVTGTKSFARIDHEQKLKNNGVGFSRGGMYVFSRTRKNGSIVNEDAAEVVDQLKGIWDASNRTTEEGAMEGEGVNDWTNDDLSKVKGPEKGGRIRCNGKFLMVKNKGSCFSQDPQVPILKARIGELQDEMKDMKENQAAELKEMKRRQDAMFRYMAKIAGLSMDDCFDGLAAEVANDSFAYDHCPSTSRASQNQNSVHSRKKGSN